MAGTGSGDVVLPLCFFGCFSLASGLTVIVAGGGDRGLFEFLIATTDSIINC